MVENLKFKVHVSLTNIKNDYNFEKYYLDNKNSPIKTKIELDKNLCYLLGWYIGDGNPSKGKKNPYRYCLSLGEDKIPYLEKIKKAVKKCLGVNLILDNKEKDNCLVVHFNSYTFDVLLKYFGLNEKLAPYKFIPNEIFNLTKELQISFLRGLLQSDGFVFIGRTERRF